MEQQDALVGQVTLDSSQRSVTQDGNQSEGKEITALLVAQDLDAEAECGGQWCAVILELVSGHSPRTFRRIGLVERNIGMMTKKYKETYDWFGCCERQTITII
jgi:hypothetical protein